MWAVTCIIFQPVLIYRWKQSATHKKEPTGLELVILFSREREDGDLVLLLPTSVPKRQSSQYIQDSEPEVISRSFERELISTFSHSYPTFNLHPDVVSHSTAHRLKQALWIICRYFYSTTLCVFLKKKKKNGNRLEKGSISLQMNLQLEFSP